MRNAKITKNRSKRPPIVRVLRVSHAATASVNRERERILAARFPIDLLLVMPIHWHELGAEHDTSVEEPFQIERVGILGAGNVPLFALDPVAIKRSIVKFKPDIVDIHEEAYSVSGFQCAWLAKRYAPKAACVFYSAQNIVKQYPPPFCWTERFVYRQCNGAYPCSQGVQETLQKKGFVKSAPVIPLGFDQSLFRPNLLTEAERGLAKEQFQVTGFTIGFFGRIVESKGVTFLLEAVAQLPKELEWTLMIVGSGGFQSAAQSLSKSLGIESRIRWLGERRTDEIPELLSVCDVVVIPSVTTTSWKEQFGRIAIEAMACGVPVIASDSGSLPEVLGGCGLIVKERNANEINEQLVRLHADQTLRQELSRKGAEVAASKYTWNAVAQMLFDLYGLASS